MGRETLAVNTDAATFTLAILGTLGCAGMAAIGWWTVLHARSSTHRASWQEYVGLVLGIWILIDSRKRPLQPRGLRFVFGITLFALALNVAISLTHLPSETVRQLSLWSGLTMALITSAMSVWCSIWLWRKLREAHRDAA